MGLRGLTGLGSGDMKVGYGRGGGGGGCTAKCLYKCNICTIKFLHYSIFFVSCFSYTSP